MAKISSEDLVNTVTANDDIIITRHNVNSANTHRAKVGTVARYMDTRGSANLGVVTSGNVALAANNGPLQYLTCNGTITILTPNTDCMIDLMIVNGSNANSVSFSGFQKEIDGDTYANTANNSYFIQITRIKSISVFKVNDLQ